VELPLDRLKTMFSEVIESDFATAVQQVGDESIYAFAVYITDDLVAPSSALNTEAAYIRAVEKDDSARHPGYRWYYGEWPDWPFPWETSDAWGLINNELERLWDTYDGEASVIPQDEDEPLTEYQGRILQVIVDSLAECSDKGVFGRGEVREKVVVFLTLTDNDRSVAVEDWSARQINPESSTLTNFLNRYADLD